MADRQLIGAWKIGNEVCTFIPRLWPRPSLLPLTVAFGHNKQHDSARLVVYWLNLGTNFSYLAITPLVNAISTALPKVAPTLGTGDSS
jgi:hypothetical protein